MGIVGGQEDLVSGDGDAAVRAGRGPSADAFGPRTLIMPKGTAATRIKGIHLVDRAHVHNSVDRYRRALHLACIAYCVDPHRREPAALAGVICVASL